MSPDHRTDKRQKTSKRAQATSTTAETRYRQQVIDAYKHIQLTGFEQADLSLEQIPLENIFVRLTLSIKKHTDQHEQSQKYIVDQHQRLSNWEQAAGREPISIDQALSKHLLLVGEPGAGKSTFQRWLAITFAQRVQRQVDRIGLHADADRLPVFIELGHLPPVYLHPQAGESLTWLTFLPRYIVGQAAFTGTPPQMLEQALKRGRCILFFDGLDEVADVQARSRLIRSLMELVRLVPGNRVVIGSRPAALSDSEAALRPMFQLCHLERFTSDDVRRFLTYWYALDHRLSDEERQHQVAELYRQLQAEPHLLQLTKTPLLCTMLLLIWRNDACLPKRRVDLYERCCRALLTPWEVHHGIAFQETEQRLTAEQHLRLLAPVAYALHEAEQHVKDNKELQALGNRELILEYLAMALVHEGLAPTKEAAQSKAERLLDVLGGRSGLLQYQGKDQRGQSHYAFPHLTFQEYLTARFIAAQQTDQCIDLVMKHLHEAWWQQIHLLTVGLLGSNPRDITSVAYLFSVILQQYPRPPWPFRPSQHAWVRLLQVGKYLPFVYLERSLTWLLGRNVGFCMQSCDECSNPSLLLSSKTGRLLSQQAVGLIRELLRDNDRRYGIQPTFTAILTQPLLQLSGMSLLKIVLKGGSNIEWRVDRGMAKILEPAVAAGNRQVIQALLKALHDPDKNVRQRAIQSLKPAVAVGNEQVIQFLMEALRHPDKDIRWPAIRSLELAVVAGNEQVIQFLMEALHDPDWSIRWYAILSLRPAVAAGNEQVIQALVEALRHPDKNVQWHIESLEPAVAVGNEQVIQFLMEALHDASGSVRWYAIGSLEPAVAVGNEQVIQALVEALHDPDWSVEQEYDYDPDDNTRTKAIRSLEPAIAAGNEQAIQALLEALHDASRRVRWRATWMFEPVIEAGNEQAIQALLKALHDADQHIRKGAILSLRPAVAANNEQVIQVLLKILHDPDEDVSEKVAESLQPAVAANNEQVIQVFLEALNDHRTGIRWRAIWILQWVVAVGNKQVIQPLLKALHDPDMNVRQRAIGSLEPAVAVGNKQVIQALLKALHDPDKDVQRYAIESLSQAKNISSPQIRHIIIALIRSMYKLDSTIRSEALQSLVGLLDGRSLPMTHWTPMIQQRVRRRKSKQVSYWLLLVVLLCVFSIMGAWLIGHLDPNGLLLRFLEVITVLLTSGAAIAQLVGRSLSDPWRGSKYDSTRKQREGF